MPIANLTVPSCSTADYRLSLCQSIRLWPNPALNLAPFSRWTLRDKAAQRRLALRYAS